jgi:glutathione S-transferase
MMKLYDFAISGNCYKVRLMLSFLELNYESVLVNLREQEQKSPSFLQFNELGQVPVLFDRKIYIRDSQAILVYLARQYGDETWLPSDAVDMSKVIQWLSNAANEISNGLAAARVYYLLGRTEIDIKRATLRSHSILDVMNRHLSTREWLECDRVTIADVACFPYILLSHEGKISLEDYPQVMNWVNRFKQLPKYIPMTNDRPIIQ